MKKRPVRSAFVRVRSLLVLVVSLAGVFLALFGHGIFSSAEAQRGAYPRSVDGAATATSTPIPCAILAYVSNTCSNDVSVIDTSNNTVVGTIPVFGTSPGGVAVNPAGTRVYVTNNFPPYTVSVIDTSSNSVVAIVPVGGQGPQGVAVTPDGTRAYVANLGSGSSTVSVIDTSTNTVVATVGGMFYPYGVAVKPDGTRVYVTNSGNETLSVIDTSNNTVVATVGAGAGPEGVVVNPDGTHAYVADNFFSHYVLVVDTSTNTVVATVAVGSQPLGMALKPDGSRVYVANSASNTVSVIDTSTNTVVATVPVGSAPTGVSVTPDGTRAYVTNYFSNTVSVIDTSNNTVIATVPVGTCPNAFGNFIAAVPCPSPSPTPTPTPSPRPCELRVLIVYADGLIPADFQWEIQNQPNVASVDLFDGRDCTPTLTELQQYDIVVPLNYIGVDFQDRDTLGNNLADYVDGGGVVVQYGLSYRTGIFGRWLSGNYNPYYYTGDEIFFMPFTLGTFNAAHPLMAGVTTLNSNFADVVAPVGSTQVAQMNNGDSLVAFRQVSGGHTTVGVAGYTGDYAFESGDWGKVVVNAGNWLYNCQPGGPTPTPSPTCEWQVVTPMPTDLLGAAGASDGTSFYVASGYSWSQNQDVNTLYRWSPDPPPNGSWTTLAPMPQAASVAMAVYYPPTNKIYVFGGDDDNNGTVLNITRIYDITSDTWSIGAPMPDVRGQSAAGYSPATGQIYIVSGYNTPFVQSAQPNTWAYDPVADSWTDLTDTAPFPHPAGGFAYGVINNKLYIAGGRDAYNQVINITWEYDPVANTYTLKAPEPYVLQNNVPGSAVASGLLWVFGGGNPFNGAGAPSDSGLPLVKNVSELTNAASPGMLPGRVRGQVLPTTADSGRYYDPASDTWTSSPNLVVARSFPAGGAIGDTLLIAAGGYNGSISVATVQKETVCIGTPSPTPTVTPTSTPCPSLTPTPTPILCSVTSAVCGSIISTQPIIFVVNATCAVDPATLQPSDFTVNGTPANFWTLSNGNTTIAFVFNTSPVVEGLNTMHIPAGAFNCCQGTVLDFTCTFTYEPASTPTPTPRATPTPRIIPTPRVRPTPRPRP